MLTPRKPIVWIVLLCCLAISSNGQLNNNIFNGSSSDGFDQEGTIQISGNLIFAGGNGDGHDFNNYFPIIGNNLFFGGSGDGFDFDFYLQPTSNMLFAGGDGDGYDFSSFIQEVNNGIYAGGIGDGHDALCYQQTSNSNIFAGGISDGHDFLRYIQLSSNTIFSGGPGDGFDKSQGFALPCSIDSITVLVQTCTPGDTGTTITSLTNIGGCDSVVTLVTSLINSYDTTISLVSCNPGDTGVFIQNLPAQNGCDSVVTTIVSLDAGSQTTLQGMSICEGDSLSVFGIFRYSAGVYYDTLPNQNGCDSILAKALTVNPIDTTLLNSVTSDSTMAGISTTTLSNQFGCDSVVITTVIYSPDSCVVDSTTIHAITCDSAMAGVSVNVLMGGDGCDSVVTTVTVFDAGGTVSLPDLEICQGDTAMVFGNEVVMAGMYSDTLLNQNGCDSIVVVNVVVNPIDTVVVNDSICVGDSLYVGQAWQTMAGLYIDVLTSANGCDSILTTMLSVKDSIACDTATNNQSCLTVVSDNSWMKSTTVTPSNLFGYWPGVSSLPGVVTFTDPVVLGQPYGYSSINSIEGTGVVSTGNSVTYFRKEFSLTNTNDLDVRLLITVDDQADIYLNGHRVALITAFGRPNYKYPAHDVKFNNPLVSNGFMSGDSYDVVTAANLDTLLKAGVNDVTVAIRNLGKPNDLGGFSFRMDINCADSIVTKKGSTFDITDLGLLVYPNPAKDVVNIDSELAINSVRLFDFTGKLVYAKTYDSEKSVKINLEGLPKGVYVVEVEEIGYQVTTVKVVKQ